MRNKYFAVIVFVVLTANSSFAATIQRLSNRDFENANHTAFWTVPPEITVLDYVANAPPSWNPGLAPTANGPWGPQTVRNNAATVNVDMTQTVTVPAGIYDFTISGWVRVYDDTAGQSRGRIGLHIDGNNMGFVGLDNNAGTITIGDGDPVPGPAGWSPWTQVSRTTTAQQVTGTTPIMFTFRVVSNSGSGWSQVNGDAFSLTTFANNATITAPGSISFGRVMQHQTPSINLDLSKTGSDAATYSALATAGISLTADGNIAAGSPQTETIGVQLQNVATGSATTGAKSYSVTIDNTATTGVTGSGEGAFDVDDIVGVTGTVVADRTILASAVNLGNVIVNATSQSDVSTLTTTGNDDQFTRVTVNGTSATDGSVTVAAGLSQLFNSPASTANRSVSGVFATAGAKSGTVFLSTTGEGLTGENVNSVGISYTANAYDASSAAFASNSGTSLSVDLGTFTQGSGLQSISDAIYNILQTTGFTAELDFDTISGIGDTGVLYTDLANGAFTALAAGEANAFAFDMTFDTDNAPGTYSATYELRFSDADAYAGASAIGSQVLTLNLTGTVDSVVIPEPASLILLAIALGLPALSRRSRA